MKTKIIMSIVVLATLSVVFACSKNGAILNECTGSIEKCANFCIANPDVCAPEVSLNPELKRTIDSLQAVSKLSVME